MSPHKTVEIVSNAVASAVRGVFPRHAEKELARLMNKSLGWAHEVLYRRFSSAHRRDLARALLREMEKQDVARIALRRQLATWAAEETGGTDAMGARVDSVLDRRRLAPDRETQEEGMTPPY